MNKMVLNVNELDKVVGGIDAKYCKFSSSEYAAAGINSFVDCDGKRCSIDPFKYANGVEAHFTFTKPDGTEISINSALADKAVTFMQRTGKAMPYEVLYTPIDDINFSKYM